jgi:hypothetical protein
LAASAGNRATSRGQEAEGQHYAVVDRDRSCRITREPDRGRDAEDFTGRDVAHHDLFARRRGLAGAHVTMQQQEKGMGVRALLEHCAVLGVSRGTGLAQNLGELVRAKSPKER